MEFRDNPEGNAFRAKLFCVKSASGAETASGTLGSSGIVVTAKKKYLVGIEDLSMSNKIILWISVGSKKKCYQEII